MTRQFSAFTAAGVLGLSAVMLAACGRTPTGPSRAAQGPQEPNASVTAPTPVAAAAVGTPDDGDASVSAREQELLARERELRQQQEALRRERERLATEHGRGEITVAASSSAFDADGTAAPAIIQKVPTPPIVVPSGTPLQIELAANVDTRVARVGDRVEGRLAEDLVLGDRRAAVAGAAVSGKVTGAPSLELTFDSLQAANGATVPIVARHVERGESATGEDAAKVLGGEMKLRAGTVITVPTQISFSIY